MRRETLIEARHLERLALVYIRQSTLAQVRENRESTRLQYGLEQLAAELGWPRERIQVIDEDLGVSGAGDQRRSGFARLVLEVARGKVGAVFGLDPSRFSRNEPEWFDLVYWLRVTRTLMVTDEGVYDVTSGNDSFVLGVHGALSAAELYKIRSRMDKGKLSKAQRGELYTRVATGYVLDGRQLRKDPDEHVREAIGLVFTRFRELGTARQVARELRTGGVQLPTREHDGRGLQWRKATYSRVWRILRNPVMGGAYAWGRTRTSVYLDGRDEKQKSQRTVPMEKWKVLLPRHHEGYVEWEEWLEIQQRLAANGMVAGGGGAPREGRALLQGVAVCGHCGLGMQVRYASAVQYRCRPGQDGQGGCQQLGGMRLDRLVAEALLEALQPAGVEAALRAERMQGQDRERQLLGHRREVQRREWDERKARREYREIEPEFRRVKKTLAAEWERAQEQLEEARAGLERARQSLPVPAQAAEGALEGLAGRLRAVWEDRATGWRDRKRLLAAVLEEVVLTADREARKLRVLLRWRGGWVDERELPLRPPVQGVRTEASTLALVRRLAQWHADAELAEELNRRGLQTATGLAFSATNVRGLRERHGIPARRKQKDAGPETVSVAAAAGELGVSVASLYRWIGQGLVPAGRAGPGGPLGVRLDASVRAKFRETAPDGYVPAAEALRELGVSRQTLWSRIREGSLQALRVVRGPDRGLYVLLGPSGQPCLPGLDEAGEDGC